MPQLFSLPKQVPLDSAGALLPGAKLFFFATNSSTPQNTYTNIGLSVAHENPVEADSDGVFAPIYLDPALPNYRVTLTTSDDVQLWQLDDIPSNQNTAQTFRLKATTPELIFEETDASSNNKRWAIRVNGEKLIFGIYNDAESIFTEVFTLDRTGTTADLFTFKANTAFEGDITATGSASFSGEDVATGIDAQFTATVTGFSNVSSLNCHYVRYKPSEGGASTIILFIPAFTGTSNATTFTLTGVPTAAAAEAGTVNVAYLIDNGSATLGTVAIGNGGTAQTITFGLAGASGGFTNSGTKGIGSAHGGFYITLVYRGAA